MVIVCLKCDRGNLWYCDLCSVFLHSYSYIDGCVLGNCGVCSSFDNDTVLKDKRQIHWINHLPNCFAGLVGWGFLWSLQTLSKFHKQTKEMYIRHCVHHLYSMILAPALFLSAALFNGSASKCSCEESIAYEGDWKDNKRYGYGVHYCYAHGERYEGDWQDNIVQAYWICIWKNNNR